MDMEENLPDKVIRLSKELDDLRQEYEQLKITLKRKKLEIQNKQNEIELTKLTIQETNIPDVIKAKKKRANDKPKMKEYKDDRFYYSQDQSYSDYVDYYKNIKSYND